MATGAAFLALFGGVQVAQAGIGDVVDDPIGAVENALPNPEETDLDAVVEEATEAVDEATGSVDAEAAVSEAKGAVEEAVADPKGTAENAVEQAKNTVENPTGTIKDIAAKTPAGKVVAGVTKSLDPVVSSAGEAIGSPKGQAGAPGASAARSEAARPGSKRSAPALSIEAPASPQAFSAAAPGATLTLGRPGSIASSCFGADRPDRRAVGSGRLDAAGAGFCVGEGPQGFLRGSGCTVRSASSWRPARDGRLRRRRSRSRTSRCALQRALLLGPEDRPIGSAWTEPRTGRTLPFSPRTPRLGRQLP